jgi:hypothetical protein
MWCRAEKLLECILNLPAPVPPARSCACCGCEELPKLQVCRGCDAARYCSKACQEAHWPEHSAGCRKLAGGGGVAGAREHRQVQAI